MDLANRFVTWFNRFLRVNPKNTSSDYGSGPGVNSNGQQFINNNPPVYADPDVNRFIREGFSGNASVYTIISKAARKFGHITRGVYTIKDKKAYKAYSRLCRQGLSTKGALQKAMRLQRKAYDSGEAVSNDLSALLDRPNPKQGQDAFFELAKIFYKASGETFIWLNRGDTDELSDDEVKVTPVLEMYILPSQNVEIIPDMDDVWDVLGYWFVTYGTTGDRFFVRKVDMIHWKTPNPNFDGGPSREHLRGLPPLRPGNKVLQQDDDSTDAAVAMYQNGGAKGALYNKSMNSLNPVQQSQLKELIDNKINNKQMKAAVAALNGDWGYVDIGLDSTEMELLKGGEQAFTRLCNLLDVPPALFLTDQTYENKTASVKDWLTNSVIPAACSLRDEMNRVLLPAFGLTGVLIDNDISDIPELQDDLKNMIAWLKDAWWLTPNQKLEYMGEEESAEEGMDDVWIPNNLIRMQDAGMDGIDQSLTEVGLNDYNPEPPPIKKLNGKPA